MLDINTENLNKYINIKIQIQIIKLYNLNTTNIFPFAHTQNIY